MHQYLFYIGDFPVRMYGLCLTLAIFLAIGVAYFLAKQKTIREVELYDICVGNAFLSLFTASFDCRLADLGRGQDDHASGAIH